MYSSLLQARMVEPFVTQVNVSLSVGHTYCPSDNELLKTISGDAVAIWELTVVTVSNENHSHHLNLLMTLHNAIILLLCAAHMHVGNNFVESVVSIVCLHLCRS